MTTITSKRKHACIRQNHRCHYCECPMWLHHPSRFAARHFLSFEMAALAKCTAEHLKPKCEGGTNEASNIVAACAYCNHRRHQVDEPMDPVRYREFVQDRVRQGTW